MTLAMPMSTDPVIPAEGVPDLGRWKRLPRNAKAGVIVLGFFVLVANLVVDLIVVFVDPRVRAGEAGR